MQVEPQAARFQTETTTNGFRAVIPARRHFFVILFLLAWLGGWSFGEVSAIRDLSQSGNETPSAFLAFWLTGWTLGGIVAMGTVLWQLAGREIITANSLELSHRVEIFGVGRTRTFRAPDVKSLRATEFVSNFSNQRAWLPSFIGSGYGPVAFDYGARTIRVAPSLEEAEAKMLVQKLAAWLPHSRETSSL